ncbi:MAG TPA: hydroxyisourate hydrolase [Terriglobales bacterium]|nr:hydroxyisourate hydrolase [Terriglobales bacterium]
MSKITTHVLDVSQGRPAPNVAIRLESQSTDGSWMELGHGATDNDGRLKDLTAEKNLPPGIYRLSFDTGSYFAKRQLESLYPQITIQFEVKPGQEHYHIPLLLSPFGYSTYRGS